MTERAKTLYVSDDDAVLWDQLAVHAKTQRRSVSFIVTQLVRQFLEQLEPPVQSGTGDQ